MAKFFQIKIELHGIAPSIWRRVLVPHETTFYELHHIVQIAMGWFNSHLYEFEYKEHLIGNPDILDDEGIIDDDSVLLDDVLTGEDEEVKYTYDFGDNWVHSLFFEKVVEKEVDDVAYPICIDGSRNAPPEDCGGIPGYYHLLEVFRDKDSEEYDQIVEWLGEEFDPEEFNIEIINSELEDIQGYIDDYEDFDDDDDDDDDLM